MYGLQELSQKFEFMEELLVVGQLHTKGAWCVVGDFNPLLAECDKNNSNVNRRLISRFQNIMNSLELHELYLLATSTH